MIDKNYLQGLSDRLEVMANTEKTNAKNDAISQTEQICCLAKANAYLDVVLILLGKIAEED